MNDNMKKAREAAGLSQKEVAISLQVSAPTVSEWESEKKNPSSFNLKELSKLYNVSTDYLLQKTDEMFYSEETSRKICAAIIRAQQENPGAFNGFFIPNDVQKRIADGTYQFSNTTFPQFEKVLGKTVENFINEIGFDDFTYAMYNEGKELTEENKRKLLEMAQFFKEQQDKEKRAEMEK